MDRKSSGMKEEERERISEMDIDGWIKQQTSSLMNSHSRAPSTLKVGHPRPFIGTGGVPSYLSLSSPALCFSW